jgi:thiol-disulfide isomerase/thioredoxin
LLKGEKLLTTGKSWCPDCVAAEPLIEQALSELSPNYVLLECPVVKEDYRKSDYLYRVDPVIQLKCVPTFIKWAEDGPADSLNDSDSQNMDLVRKLVSKL